VQQHAFRRGDPEMPEDLRTPERQFDNLADPASVFVYRGEPREVAEALGVNCAPFTGPVVPIIYQLNLRDPAGYFFASFMGSTKRILPSCTISAKAAFSPVNSP